MSISYEAIEHLIRGYKEWLRWPLVNEKCWIGIGLDRNAAPVLFEAISKAARVTFGDLDDPDAFWAAWHRLPVLSFERIDNLHAQLTTNREASQAELIKELIQWASIIRRAEGSVPRSSV